MPAVSDWVKQNVPKGAAMGSLLFLPGYVKELSTAENKLKAIVKITADWLTWTLKVLAPLRTYIIGGALVKGFVAVGDAIKSIVRSTGSLQAALERLKTIQLTQQQLAPFLGGLYQAKQRVAELVTLSSKGPFKFEEIAQANKSLEIFTHGMFSSVKATQAIGQAAIATGNNITDIADAVGDFYQNLREGRPIGGAAEQLRQLGILSDQAAGDLVKMAQSGATTAEIMGRLTGALSGASEGLSDLGDDLNAVTAEHAKAAEQLKVAFGAPWTAAEVETTKNMTAAMQAIAPTVQKVSGGFAILYNGLGTFKSSVVRAAAEFKPFQKAIEGVAAALQAALAAAVLFGTVGLATLIPKVSGLAAAAGASLIPMLEKIGLSFNTAAKAGLIFGNTLRLVGFLSIGAGIAAGVAAIAGTIMAVVHANRESAREAERMRNAFQKSASAIQMQASAAKTLAERNEALAKSTNLVASAQEQLNQKWKESHTWQRFLTKAITMGPLMGAAPERKEVTQARENVKRAKELERQMMIEGTAGLTGPERAAAMAQARERAQIMQEAEFQAKMSTRTGGARIRAIEERAGTLGARAEMGREGVQIRARLAEEEARRRQQIAEQFPVRSEREKQLGRLRMEMIGRREMALSAAGGETATSLEAKAERMRHGMLAGSAAAAAAAGGVGAGEKQRLAVLAAGEKELAGGLEYRTDKEQEIARLQVQQIENAAAIAKQYEDSANALEEQSKELQKQAALERDAQKLRSIQVGTDLQTSKLKGTSAQKAAEEYEIRRKGIQAEMAHEIMRSSKIGGPRAEVMAELQGRLNIMRNEEAERRRGMEVTRQEADIDLQRRRAEREGRTQEADMLGNREEFMKRMEQHRAEGMGDEESRMRAMQETAETIAGRETIPGGISAVASSMQRIGGGGGVYTPGGDPAVAIQKQIMTLNQQAVTYLAIMAGQEQGVR